MNNYFQYYIFIEYNSRYYQSVMSILKHYSNFQKDFVSVDFFSFLHGPYSQFADHLPTFTHSFAYSFGWNSFSGGPSMLININDDRCFTDNMLRTSVQMIFMIEKPLSHSALLTVMIIDEEYRRFNLGNLSCSKVQK